MQRFKTRWGAGAAVALLLILALAGVVGAAGLPASDNAADTADEATQQAEQAIAEHTDLDADELGENEAPEVDNEGNGPEDNHGADVSAVAQDKDAVGGENENHGGAVSEVARDNHGHETSAGATGTTQASEAKKNKETRGRSGEHTGG
ncbi:MAG TPA: hypothetical protein VFK38_02660 [Candidatus Limnocylindrales bacterium]|nr:hypothetical protein [Candidatus Limnocylindrales bacterium]